jgi:hypothetical protein
MEKNWERSAKIFDDKLMFGDKCIYPNDKFQALNQKSYALRTLDHRLKVSFIDSSKIHMNVLFHKYMFFAHEYHAFKTQMMHV